MINIDEKVCPKCNGKLIYYDTVNRIVRMKNGVVKYIKIRRFRCKSCHSIHRELPNFIFPYKQYEADVINGVVDGYITPETLGYEDYPCEMTMNRWKISNEI